MKTFVLYFIALALLTASCNKLDLTPPDQPSSATYYSNQTELELAVDDLYRVDFWSNDNETYTDNFWYRGELGNAVTFGTMNSQDANVQTYYQVCYNAIARANSFLANDKRATGNASAAIIRQYEAEMRLIRAYQYARLIEHFGDVPFVTAPQTLEESGSRLRTGKDSILQFIFKELDTAATILPAGYTGSQVQRLTRGAALAIKARTALFYGKWDVAAAAAQAIIQLANGGTYALYPSYSNLFLTAGKNNAELIIRIPRSQALNVYTSGTEVQDYLPRNVGGFGARLPTREMVDAYECTDGKTINQSPLYDYHNPFKNRDPRLTASIVEFSTTWLGVNYQPHPDTLKVFSTKTNGLITNNDTRANAAFASYTGFLWRKGIEQSWVDKLAQDNDIIICRYAEMLLTYAEAKIELNEIDQSVLDAINRVRARAYGVSYTQVAAYPAITTTNQAELRQIVRRERRVEFPLEGLRYLDLIRWKLAEKALTRPVIGLPDPAAQNRSKWPFPGVTPIDSDGIADYSGFGSDVKIVAQRNFDKSRQYLWPIPDVERRVNPAITQNPGY
ncbi:MAG TPA: RagB/SusD family nutrient uptake outer membrane protein [Chitinophagaceae bacterium]|nr:RagB/SusD family nutrient uptake outer membrane protein [Chitinophagaceae bacterium]